VLHLWHHLGMDDEELISTVPANKEVAADSVWGFVECQHPVSCIKDGITRCIRRGPLRWRSSLAVTWSRLMKDNLMATLYLGWIIQVAHIIPFAHIVTIYWSCSTGRTGLNFQYSFIVSMHYNVLSVSCQFCMCFTLHINVESRRGRLHCSGFCKQSARVNGE
jgi:hypothetical protein